MTTESKPPTILKIDDILIAAIAWKPEVAWLGVRAWRAEQFGDGWVASLVCRGRHGDPMEQGYTPLKPTESEAIVALREFLRDVLTHDVNMYSRWLARLNAGLAQLAEPKETNT